MPTSFLPPKYSRQVRPNGRDRAYVRIDGKRIYLGGYGSEESRLKYAEVVKFNGSNPTIESPESDSAKDDNVTFSKPESTNDEPPQYITADQDVDAGEPDPDAPFTVNRILVGYLEHAQVFYQRPEGRPANEYQACIITARWLRDDAGRELAKEFGPKRLKRLRELMIADGLSRSYINQHAKRICRIFTWAASEEMIDPQVPAALKTVANLKKGRSKAKENGVVCSVSDAVVKATLKKLPVVLADMVRLQRLTGMRPFASTTTTCNSSSLTN